ncbi:hypothetical protein PRIEUP_LOCUS692 [Pristimantis euphronides]
MFSVFPNGSLFLRHLERGDEGTYTVDVFNVSGNLVHHAEIGLQIVDVFADHMFYLSLESRSPNHPLQVQWIKGEEDVDRVFNESSQVSSNGSLYLQNVQKADEGMYSALVFNSSLFLIHRTDILLYVNVSEVEAAKSQSLSLCLIIFTGIMAVFCLTVIPFITLGIFLWKWRNKKKTDIGNSSVIYVTIRRHISRKNTQNLDPSDYLDTQTEVKEPDIKEEEEIYEVDAVSTFQ